MFLYGSRHLYAVSAPFTQKYTMSKQYKISIAVNKKVWDWWQSLPRGIGAHMVRAYLATKVFRQHDGDPFDPEVHTDDDYIRQQSNG